MTLANPLDGRLSLPTVNALTFRDMPRRQRAGVAEPKRRSRTGCWPCKIRKVKCDERRPDCENCERQGEPCDYSIRLNWEGRGKNKATGSRSGFGHITFASEAVNTGAGAETSQTGLKGTCEGQRDNTTRQTANEREETRDTALAQPLPPDSMVLDDGTSQPVQFAQSYERAKPVSRNFGPNPFSAVAQQDSGEFRDMPPPFVSSVPPQSYEIINSPMSNSNATSPNTAITSASLHSDGSFRYPNLKLPPLLTRESRGFSVSSLLSGPPGISDVNDSRVEAQSWDEYNQDLYQDTNTWGIDRGFKDLDLGKNDDTNAISGSSPVSMRDHLDFVLDDGGAMMPVEFGFGVEVDHTAFDHGGYYASPVPISIPRALEPLPNKLLENPMNLLYFHHFTNHTAGCLIPHNCSSNPFKRILPRMAVQDDNLLNLLLAYSASHRARLLRQPEPATRIALWVQDIFPSLRKALDDPAEIISNANLATAIMLASLEIISPKAFGVAVPWQKHLDTARQIIAARGGPQGMRSASRGDKVASFLWSWFAYLDVLGSLSRPSSSSSTWFLEYETSSDNEEDYHIDCVLGFTSRCVRLLAKIAELARACDSERISGMEILVDWKPSSQILEIAAKIDADLAASRLHPAKPCTHMQSSGEAAYQWDNLEMSATNEAYHWAGAVHLHRRILGKPSTHVDVQNAVREIYGALFKVRRGSAAEAGLLFPMFTAGCDTIDEKQRNDILDRVKGVEVLGLSQVHKARTLMERTWETGKPWETLVTGEFFG